jgi:hypothetical protein
LDDCGVRAKVCEHFGLEFPQAQEPPVADGNPVDQELFVRVGGCEVLLEHGAEVFKLRDVFLRQHDQVCGEAVTEGIEAAGGAALGSLGAAFGSVTSIGGNLAG